jgi:hypothetical protein
MSYEFSVVSKLPEDLTLEEFHAIPKAADQEHVLAIGHRCLAAWQQDKHIGSLFDLSIAERILDKGMIACIELPVLRGVFSKTPVVNDGSPIHVGDADYIFIPQYPTAYLEKLIALAKQRTQFNGFGLPLDAKRNMGLAHKEILLDQRFIIEMLLEGDYSEAVRLLELSLTEEHKDSLYIVAISEELAHAVVDPLTRRAENQPGLTFLPYFPEALSESMANGLSLKALTLEDLTRLSLLSDWSFKMLSAIFLQELVENGLIDGMRVPVWDDGLIVKLREKMRKIYGSDSFDPHTRDNYLYPPEGYKPADWLAGLKK